MSKNVSHKVIELNEVSPPAKPPALRAFVFIWHLPLQACPTGQTLSITARLYECEIWSLTLREEHRLCVYVNGILRGMFIFKAEGVGSRDSAVGIATGYGLDGRGVGVRVPVGARFSPLHVVQTGPGASPASYPMGSGSSFPGVKRPGREADDSPPTNAEVNNTWIYTSTPLYVFVA
jgi:hypothetical protein